MARRLFRVAALGAATALLVSFVNLVPGLFLLTAVLEVVVWLVIGVAAVLQPPRISTVRGAAGFAALAGLAAALLNTALVLVIDPLLAALRHNLAGLVANAGPEAVAAAQQLGLDPVRFPGVLLVYAAMLKDALVPALLLYGFLSMLAGGVTGLVLRRVRPQSRPAPVSTSSLDEQVRYWQQLGWTVLGAEEARAAEAAAAAQAPDNPRVRAQSAQWVAQLVALYKSSFRGEGFLTNSTAAEPVQEIGEEINALGGKPLMLRVHAAFAAAYPLGARNLEMVWDGIGEWRG